MAPTSWAKHLRFHTPLTCKTTDFALISNICKSQELLQVSTGRISPPSPSSCSASCDCRAGLLVPSSCSYDTSRAELTPGPALPSQHCPHPPHTAWDRAARAQGSQHHVSAPSSTYVLQSRTLELSPHQTLFFPAGQAGPDCSDLLEVLTS